MIISVNSMTISISLIILILIHNFYVYFPIFLIYFLYVYLSLFSFLLLLYSTNICIYIQFLLVYLSFFSSMFCTYTDDNLISIDLPPFFKYFVLLIDCQNVVCMTRILNPALVCCTLQFWTPPLPLLPTFSYINIGSNGWYPCLMKEYACSEC